MNKMTIVFDMCQRTNNNFNERKILLVVNRSLPNTQPISHKSFLFKANLLICAFSPLLNPEPQVKSETMKLSHEHIRRLTHPKEGFRRWHWSWKEVRLH